MNKPDTTSPWRDPVARLIVAVYALFLLTKLYLITHLELFGDEAFYWQCAQRMALAFSDHPFVTASLVKGGTLLAGNSFFGIRLLFLVIGSLLPFAVGWLALPLAGKRGAILAGGTCLLIPYVAGAGLIATPDFPLQLLAVLSVASFERATRTGTLRYWVLTGLLGALGLCVHYRFVLFPAGAFIYLVATHNGREQWRNPGMWLCGLILLAGLAFVLFAVFDSGLNSLHYQFIDRHPWHFHAVGLLHPVVQALNTTPLLYAVLLITLVDAARRGWRGEDRYALLAIIAGLHTATFWLLAPWSDTEHMTRHWPLPGYLPLLALLPDSLRRVSQWFGRRYGERAQRPAYWIVPVTALAGSAWLLFKLVLTVLFAGSNLVLPDNLISKRMIGWRLLAEHAQTQLSARPNPPQLILSSNYYASAQLEFITGMLDRVFVLDNSYLREAGRAAQYEKWQLNDAWLRRRHPGEDALVAVNEATLHKDRVDNILMLCRMFESLERVDQVSQDGKAFRYGLFIGTGIRPPGADNMDHQSCPTPAHVMLDSPVAGAQVSGLVDFTGWAFNDARGISSIELRVDGKFAGLAHYGLSRPDVFQAYSQSTDPNHPNVGFNLQWDSGSVPAGRHEVSLRVISVNSDVEEEMNRRIFVMAK